ncbi:hypothetical protein GCM10022393_12610 [Aquimarina addita]|uniref:Methyltransferase type 11 domain-containing protein n=1 Tax=Aquimarina addita TaxID=870485 RepID=A0ABP7XFT9_9FLAO
MNQKVTDYYNDIADTYDSSRFKNTYGAFIDQQERSILNRLLKGVQSKNILDIGCGTGRFLEFADYGVDISSKMIRIAKAKYPTKQLFNESATDTHFDDCSFDIIISFHVFMHLDKATMGGILDEAYRILRKGGKLLFDIPSKKRRNFVGYKTQGWHGANHLSVTEIKELCDTKWNILNYYGILFLPIHRVPVKLRNKTAVLDNALCTSFLKEYSSYLLFELEKR